MLHYCIRGLPTPLTGFDIFLPSGARIGPLGGGYARHRLFQDWSAPLPLNLSISLSVFRSNICQNSSKLRMSHLCSASQIWRATSTSIRHRRCPFDFGTVGLLPETFVVYTVTMSMKPLDVCRCHAWLAHLSLLIRGFWDQR